MTTSLPAEEKKDVIADVEFCPGCKLINVVMVEIVTATEKREIFAKNREKLSLCFHSLIDANIFYTNIILLVG